MNKLEQYVLDHFDGASDWFISEVGDSWHINRVNNCLDLSEYLDGKHSILRKEDEMWKGRVIKTRKIVLQFVKPIITFQNSFILNNPITLTSDCPETLEAYKEVYKKGKYENIDSKILDSLLKFGEVFEYVFVDDDKKIKSHLIKGCDAYPIFNDKSEYIGLIEHYITGGVSYYTIYTADKVVEYSDRGGELFIRGEHKNLSGVPIRYLLPSDGDSLFPRSDLEDWIGIIDEMEVLTSKYFDSFFRFLSPIGVMSGTKLGVGKDGEGAINPNIAGNILQLDLMSKFEYALPKMDVQSFDKMYKTLYQALMTVSMTPNILSNTDISNISTESMRILFYMAIAKAGKTSKHMYEGMDTRWKQMKKLIELIDGRTYVGYISGTFKYDVPSVDKEIVENLKTLREMDSISMETLLSQSPYIFDVGAELEKLESENIKQE